MNRDLQAQYQDPPGNQLPEIDWHSDDGLTHERSILYFRSLIFTGSRVLIVRLNRSRTQSFQGQIESDRTASLQSVSTVENLTYKIPSMPHSISPLRGEQSKQPAKLVSATENE
jgi:hypothetical protein